jgi:hypothetical protein
MLITTWRNVHITSMLLPVLPHGGTCTSHRCYCLYYHMEQRTHHIDVTACITTWRNVHITSMLLPVLPHGGTYTYTSMLLPVLPHGGTYTYTSMLLPVFGRDILCNEVRREDLNQVTGKYYHSFFFFFNYQLMHKRIALKGILKFTLKQLQHVSV